MSRKLLLILLIGLLAVFCNVMQDTEARRHKPGGNQRPSTPKPVKPKTITSSPNIRPTPPPRKNRTPPPPKETQPVPGNWNREKPNQPSYNGWDTTGNNNYNSYKKNNTTNNSRKYNERTLTTVRYPEETMPTYRPQQNSRIFTTLPPYYPRPNYNRYNYSRNSLPTYPNYNNSYYPGSNYNNGYYAGSNNAVNSRQYPGPYINTYPYPPNNVYQPSQQYLQQQYQPKKEGLLKKLKKSLEKSAGNVLIDVGTHLQQL